VRVGEVAMCYGVVILHTGALGKRSSPDVVFERLTLYPPQIFRRGITRTRVQSSMNQIISERFVERATTVHIHGCCTGRGLYRGGTALVLPLTVHHVRAAHTPPGGSRPVQHARTQHLCRGRAAGWLGTKLGRGAIYSRAVSSS
jgi:hypothetical protein